VYSSFGGKDDLVMAVVDETVELCVAGRRDPEPREGLAIRSGAIHDQSARLIQAGAEELGVELDDEFAQRLAVASQLLSVPSRSDSRPLLPARVCGCAVLATRRATLA
jgi:hypothetical protein